MFEFLHERFSSAIHVFLVYSTIPAVLYGPTGSNQRSKDRTNVTANNGLIILITKLYNFYALVLCVTHHNPYPKPQFQHMYELITWNQTSMEVISFSNSILKFDPTWYICTYWKLHRNRLMQKQAIGIEICR